MTDDDLRMAADWLARDGANCQLHINIADEIKRRLSLRRPTAVGDMPVNIDGIDRLDAAVTRLAETVNKRDAEIDKLRGSLSDTIARSIGAELVRVEAGGWRRSLGNETTLLTYRIAVPMATIVSFGCNDYNDVRITPGRIDRD